MSEAKINQSLKNLGNALNRLAEALAEPEENTLVVDATIQRFEFVLEMFWKTLKRILEHEGITNAATPKEVLKQAYQLRWLESENIWLQMLRDRKLTSHAYNEEQAKEIYQHIQSYITVLEKTFRFLQSRQLA